MVLLSSGKRGGRCRVPAQAAGGAGGQERAAPVGSPVPGSPSSPLRCCPFGFRCGSRPLTDLQGRGLRPLLQRFAGESLFPPTKQRRLWWWWLRWGGWARGAALLPPRTERGCGSGGDTRGGQSCPGLSGLWGVGLDVADSFPARGSSALPMGHLLPSATPHKGHARVRSEDKSGFGSKRCSWRHKL